MGAGAAQGEWMHLERQHLLRVSHKLVCGKERRWAQMAGKKKKKNRRKMRRERGRDMGTDRKMRGD